jgi:hypothetical protein
MSDFQIELFPLHSPLLRESLLVSFPPLINMLKFRGSSYLISDQMLKVIKCEGMNRPLKILALRFKQLHLPSPFPCKFQRDIRITRGELSSGLQRETGK